MIRSLPSSFQVRQGQVRDCRYTSTRGHISSEFGFRGVVDVVLGLSNTEMQPHPRRDPAMSGKERSPRHRPWSVYRANTFDLSAEMMGLALSGNLVTAAMATRSSPGTC